VARSNLGSPDEALAGMAKVGKPREPMGDTMRKSVKFPSANPQGRTTKLVPKKNTAAADPTVMPKPTRKNVNVDRKGAAFGIRTNYQAPIDPAAGATQGNGRTIRSAIYRSNYNFNDGAGSSY